MEKRKMNLAVIGSGSSYLPDIAQMLINRKDEISINEWKLMDIDEYRLNCTGRFAQKMFKDAGCDTKVILTQDLEEAVKDCDFVMCTVRPGKSEGRILDETIPFKHNLIGQETTAPGGLIMGLKSIPVILEIARAIEKYAHPNCYLINLANPSGMLSEALNRHSNVKFAGLCNGPITFRDAMTELYGKEHPEDVFVKIMGLNHLIWCKVYYKGEDVTEEAFPRLLDWAGEKLPRLRKEFVTEELQKFIGWIPMGPYLQFYYEYVENFKDLSHYSDTYWENIVTQVNERVGQGVLDGISVRENATRSEVVAVVEKRAFELYEKLDPKGYQLACNTRGGHGYGDAAISLINAIWNNKNEIWFPDVCSRGCIQGLDADCVCTATSLVNATGIHPIAFEKIPAHMMSKINAAKEYEKLAVEAAVTGSYHAALEALVANPLINSYGNAKGALDELLVAEKEFLPQFKDAIEILEKGETPRF